MIISIQNSNSLDSIIDSTYICKLKKGKDRRQFSVPHWNVKNNFLD